MACDGSNGKEQESCERNWSKGCSEGRAAWGMLEMVGMGCDIRWALWRESTGLLHAVPKLQQASKGKMSFLPEVQ